LKFSIFLQKENNNIDLLRLLAAMGVIVGHAYAISPQPPLADGVHQLLGFDHSGSLAVKFFFFLSGILVANSFFERPKFFAFLIARSARLFPALFVCILLTLIVSGFFSSLGIWDYFKNPLVYSYFVKNLLLELQWELPGVFVSNPSVVVNGSLWTLPIEFFCYLFLAAVGGVGLLKNRLVGVAVFCLLAAYLLFRPDVVQYFGLPPEGWQYPLFFCFGCILSLLKDHVTISIESTLALALATFLLRGTSAYSFVMCSAIFFAAFLFVSLPIVKAIRLPGDFSYGIYLYGFPFQQLAKTIWPQQGVHENQLSGLAAALCFAVLSWYFVESPAIKLGKIITTSKINGAAVRRLVSQGFNKMANFEKSAATRKFECLGVFLLTVAGCYFFFWDLRPTVLSGDDLANYLAYQEGSFANLKNILHETFANKYRPVFGAAWAIVVGWSGINLEKIFFINVLIQSSTTVVAYLIFRLVPRVPIFLAVVCALFVGTSRFALYQVTQLTGLVENVSAFMFILAFYYVAKGYNKRFSYLDYGLSIGFLVLAVFAHERYLSAIPWFAFAWFFFSSSKTHSVRVSLFVIPFFVAVANIFIKVVLGSSVLEGTSYVKISLIPGLSFLVHFSQAFFTLIGLNYSSYHVGGAGVMSRAFAAHWIWLIILPISLFTVLALPFRFREKSENFPRLGGLLFSLAVLIIFMLIPPAYTVRLDQRWLFIPQFLIILCCLVACSEISLKFRRTGFSLLTLHCALWVPLFFILKASLAGIFFIDAANVAANIRKDVVPLLGKIPLTQPLNFAMRADHCDWTLMGGQFFKIYGGAARPIACYESASLQLNSSGAGPIASQIFTPGLDGRFKESSTLVACDGSSENLISGIAADRWASSRASFSIKNCENVLNLAFYLPPDVKTRSVFVHLNKTLVGTVKLIPGEMTRVVYTLGSAVSYDVDLLIPDAIRSDSKTEKSVDGRELGAIVSVISTLKN
jgi:peptidoglycan/LPS O-acetylase OafA/YrhL